MKKSRLLVLIQFLCIGYYVLCSSVIAKQPALLFAEIMGVLVGAMGIWSMGPRNVNVFPEPDKSFKVVDQGVYAFIRHPMYTGILLVAFALSLDNPTWHSMLVFLLLTLNQWKKINTEEDMLLDKFPEYEEYSRRTKRLIPFVI